MNLNKEFQIDAAYCLYLDNFPKLFITLLVPLVLWYPTFICAAGCYFFISFFLAIFCERSKKQKNIPEVIQFFMCINRLDVSLLGRDSGDFLGTLFGGL